MDRYRTRQIVLIALSLIAIAIAIAALVSVARFLFFSGSTASNQVSASESALVSTTADRAVNMTVRGPIVADENFRSYSIKITPNNRTLTVYKGYQNQVISTVSLGNNIPAYEQFVYALNHAKFMDGTELTGDANDQRGVCATGRVYDFKIINGKQTVKELWTSSCSSQRGSLSSSSLSQVTSLIDAQIPTFDDVTNDLW